MGPRHSSIKRSPSPKQGHGPRTEKHSSRRDPTCPAPDPQDRISIHKPESENIELATTQKFQNSATIDTDPIATAVTSGVALSVRDSCLPSSSGSSTKSFVTAASLPTDTVRSQRSISMSIPKASSPKTGASSQPAPAKTPLSSTLKRNANRFLSQDRERTPLQTSSTVFTMSLRDLRGHGPAFKQMLAGHPERKKEDASDRVNADLNRNPQDRIRSFETPSQQPDDHGERPAPATPVTARKVPESTSAVEYETPSKNTKRSSERMQRKEDGGRVPAASTETGKHENASSAISAQKPAVSIPGSLSGGGANARMTPDSRQEKPAVSKNNSSSMSKAREHAQTPTTRTCVFCEQPFKGQCCKNRFPGMAHPSDCTICRGIQALVTHSQRHAEIRHGDDMRQIQYLMQTIDSLRLLHQQEKATMEGAQAEMAAELASAKETISTLQTEVARKTSSTNGNEGKWLQVQQHRNEIWGLEKDLTLFQKQAGDRIAQVETEKSEIQSKYQQSQEDFQKLRKDAQWYIDVSEKRKQEGIAELHQKHKSARQDEVKRGQAEVERLRALLAEAKKAE